MSNMQKAFKNKAKCGLRMATGGFLTDSFDTTAPPKWSAPAQVAGLGAGRAPQQRQQSPLQGLNNQIAMGNAVENSNLTMTEKAALGMGTSSAAASQLRQQTGALTTLRDSLQQPLQMETGGILARLAGRGAQIDAAVDGAVNGAQPAAPAPVQPAAPEPVDQSVKDAVARANAATKKPGLMQGLRSKLGFAQGGVVRGPGGPTEDAVPASIGTGDDKQKLKLSDGEGFMVVPAAVMAKPEAIDAINATMAAANDGKQPVGLRGAGQTTHAANGLEAVPATMDEFKAAQVAQQRAAINAAANGGAPVASAPPVTSAGAAAIRAPQVASAEQVAMNAARTAQDAKFAQAAAAPVAPAPQAATTARAPAALKYSGVGYKMPNAEGLKAGGKAVGRTLVNVAKPLGAVAALAGAGIQGHETGSDLNEVWQNDSTDLPTKIAATAQGAGDVAGNILSLGMLQNPISHAAGLFGDTAMDRGLAGTSRARTQSAAQAAAPRAAASTPVAAPLATLPPEQAVEAAAQNRFESNQAADRLTGLAQRGMNLPADGTAVERGNAGLRAITNNGTTMRLLNASHDERGDGIKYGLRTGADGRRQVEISGNGPSAAVNPNGPKDSFGNDMTRTNDMKRQVREMEHDRIARTAAMPGATQGDMVAYAGQLKQDEIDGANATRREDAGLRREQMKMVNDNRVEDNQRANAAARTAESDKFGGRVDKLIESWAVTDGKPDGQKYAMLQKYAANVPRGKVRETDGRVREQNDKEYLQELMDHYAVDNLFESEGRHTLASEKPWAGEAARYKKEGKSDLGAILDGAMPGQESFVDPATKRRIYANDVTRNLSPNQLRLFKERALN